VKIATILGAFSVGARPLDIATAYTSPRGLTGTELGFLRVTEELRQLGHEVVTFMGDREPRGEWTQYDALLGWNEPNLFRGIHGPRRVVFQMLNDWSFIRDGFDQWVDRYVGVCEQHVDYVSKHESHPTPRSKWSVVPLGCDPHLYSDRRVPGRVIWCSSADRGLHWLLQMWPDIKAAVPEAHLKIFYHWSYGNIDKVDEKSITPQGGPYHQHIVEMAQRIRYMKHAIQVLKPLGVEHVQSVSREQMAKEFSEASVFAYPCDTVAFSEGFSCSTLEAHASYTVPVITDCDCLGSIYRDSGADVYPVRSLRFVAGVIAALKAPPGVTRATLAKCRAFAEAQAWKRTAKELEAILCA
jgi:hypothetical protein